jgi:hypothetical protein
LCTNSTKLLYNTHEQGPLTLQYIRSSCKYHYNEATVLHILVCKYTILSVRGFNQAVFAAGVFHLFKNKFLHYSAGKSHSIEKRDIQSREEIFCLFLLIFSYSTYIPTYVHASDRLTSGKVQCSIKNFFTYCILHTEILLDIV